MTFFAFFGIQPKLVIRTGHLWHNETEMVISATEFKAKCLEILDRVRDTGERILISKRGKVIAEVGPPSQGSRLAKSGFAKGQLVITGDIVEPTGEPWEALS